MVVNFAWRKDAKMQREVISNRKSINRMMGLCILLCILHFSLHVNWSFLSLSAWILCSVAWKNVFPREEKNIFKRKKFIVSE